MVVLVVDLDLELAVATKECKDTYDHESMLHLPTAMMNRDLEAI